MKRLRGGILSTVVVVAVLMLLVVMAVIALWDADFLLFSRSNHLRVQRANVESGFVLYRNYPVQDSIVTLFDSVAGSRVRIVHRPWGLYEAATVESEDGKVHRSAILGLRQAWKDDCVLWYRNDRGAVTLAGRSHIGGAAWLPSGGVAYGQMQSAFFSGEKLPPDLIRTSGETMPAPSPEAAGIVDELFGMRGEAGLPDSLTVRFRGGEMQVIAASEIHDSYLAGQVVVTGGRVKIGSGAELHDVIVVADHITVGDGFRGSVQLFAADSVTVGKDVVLDAPSGVYSRGYAEIGDGSEVNGYLIIDRGGGEDDVMKPACRKSRTSRLRGLFYCTGVARFQGLTSGAAFMDRSVHYSPQGYYEDFLYDAAILVNRETAFPLWLDGAPPARKEAKWVH